MERNTQGIYDYLSKNIEEEEINDIIYNLSPNIKSLISDRYGDDLHDLVKSDSFIQEIIKSLLAEKIIKKLEAKEKINTESDLKNQLLELIKLQKNNKEICEILNINPQQLYNLLLNLKNNGMMISRKYYSDGSIKYKQVTTMQELKKLKLFSQDRTIITDTNENQLKILAMSDLHFGNKLQRPDLIDRAFNYCAKKGINIILCGGDLIDGAYTRGEQIISDLHKQIEYLITNYPFDKNIFTISVAGDHDMSALKTEALNIIDICENYRHDIVIGGFNNTGINLKNDQILLFHHTNGGVMRQTEAPIILHGHSHIYTIEIKNNCLNITLPSISDIIQPMPSVIELDLDFNKGYINNVVSKQIFFGNQDIVLSEATFDLLTNRNVTYEPIRNIEQYRNNNSVEEKKPLTKKLHQPLSQIEKFRRRYPNSF